MRTLLPRVLSVLLAVGVVLAASAANAQSEADKATARNLYAEGQDALKSNQCEAAADKFRRAEKLYHAPTILVGLGRAYVCLGKYVLAKEQYNTVIRESVPDDAPEPFKQAVADAQKEIQGLDAKIGWVVINVQGPTEPQVTLDDVVVPPAALGVKRPVDAGPHVLKASAPGYKSAETSFTTVVGENPAVSLTLEVDPDAPAGGAAGGGSDTGATLRLVGFIGIGVGAAGLILGGVMGGLAMGKHSKLTEACGEDGTCPPDQQDNLDDFNTFGTVSTIGFIAGGVVAAAGIVLVVIGSLDSSQEGARLEVSPSSLRVSGRF